MPTLTVEHADGSTETIAQTTGYSRKRELGKMRRAMIDVERSLAQNVTLTEKSDLIHLGSTDTLRLVDVQKGGSTWTLKCYSLEWDANRVAPTVGGNARTGTDDSLVTGLVNEVPTWSAGTVTSVTGPLSFVFNHAHRHEALRRIERNTPGEIQFRDEGTVDYIGSLGSDRSGSVELSASEGTIENAIEITNRGRKLDGTHIRVLGAHEGEAQLFANLVPASDPATYDNRVDYTTSRWSSGDTRDWDRWENKDVTDQDTIEEEAASLGQEITESLVEAKTTVAAVSPVLNVGDWVQVVKPDADIDRKMRVHRVTTKVGGRTQDGGGPTRVDEVLLSTRTVARDDNVRDLRSLRQFNTGFQGTSVTATGGPLRAAIDSSHPVTFNFRYPNINYENDAELHVRGLEYRVDSQGAAGGGDHTHTVDVNHPSHDHSVTVPDHNHDFSFSWSEHTHNVTTQISDTNTSDGHTHTYVEATGTDGTSIAPIIGETVSDGGGTTETSTNALGTTSSESSDASGTHTHGVNPGIFTTNDTPSSVDVEIGGSTVATNIGSGTFETVVDITDELTTDAWNDVTLTSDALGLVQCTIYLEGYRQVGIN